MRSWAWALMLLMAGITGPARSEEDDPDMEIARRHFASAGEFYERKDYTRALEEFEAARAVRPAPAFDFNIGRCLDRMERFEEAVVAYTRYVDGKPDAEDAPKVRARIDVLKARIAARATPKGAAPSASPPRAAATEIVPASATAPAAVTIAAPLSPQKPGNENTSAPSRPAPPIAPERAASAPGPASHSPSLAAPLIVGAAALVALIAGSAVVGSVVPDYHTVNTTCPAPCPASMSTPLEVRADVGYALWGAGGVIAVVDVALFLYAGLHAGAHGEAGTAKTAARSWARSASLESTAAGAF